MKTRSVLSTKVYPFLPAQVPSRPVPARKKASRFASVEAAVARLRPSEPMQVLRPQVIRSKAAWFVEQFPGDVMFAVKTNPDPRVLAAVYEGGVRHFDVASLAEVRLVRTLFPEADAYFMHPVKPREAIAEAYRLGIRHFSLDSHEELAKILAATGGAQDLALHVRLSIRNDKAAYALDGKFGVALDRAASLIVATRQVAKRFGICFHVGSQCMDPQAYAAAVGHVRALVEQTGVKLDMLDVGGGFPSVYPGMTPPPMADYMVAIREALAALPDSWRGVQVLSEPGRALVAEGGSVVVRVDLRKGDALYINDGAYGSLFDAAHTDFVFPAKAIRLGGELSAQTEGFRLFGPTCDSMDAMKGPYSLPADIGEGDWIEIGQLGAYGATMRTSFNGFFSDLTVEVQDEPILTME